MPLNPVPVTQTRLAISYSIYVTAYNGQRHKVGTFRSLTTTERRNIELAYVLDSDLSGEPYETIPQIVTDKTIRYDALTLYTQNLMETAALDIEEQQDEMMSSEAYSLLSELNSDIASGESLGVFTPSEAAEWYAGADACTKISHLAGLLSYIDRFIASGLARLAKLENTVENDLLTSGEQSSYLNDGHRASYAGKAALISEIKNLVRGLESKKADLIRVLNKKNIDASDKSSMIGKFYSASANSKSNVVSEAENIRITEEPIEVKSERPKTLEQSPVKSEMTELPAPPKDPKAECFKWVDHYLAHEQFSQASDLVEASSRYFNLAEYRSLLKRIEKAKLTKEIPALQALLRAA